MDGSEGEPPPPLLAVAPPPDKLGRAVARARIAEKLFATREHVRLGRYHLLEQAGAGGMGVVWAAWDPELDRRVALKLVKPELAIARDRVVQEGQALAKLSHPNVVPIYDVGVIDDQLYLVMEWIQGETLRAWCKEPRTLKQTLALITAAGDGLAAIHAAGLVHRDVKPDNILVGDDGRARVTDLGLARAGEVERHDVAGTPPYMAPEQLAGEALDHRADQFALCVCAWESLFGERPFPDGAEERRAAIERGAPAATERRVPAYVVSALTRGLAADPARRWPSTAALVAALRRDPRTRWRIAAAAAAGLALAVGATAFAMRATDRDDPCAAGALEWADTWSAARAPQLAAALGGGVRWRTLAADRTTAALDDYGRRWVEAYRGVCGARGGAAVQEARARGLQCLADRRRSVASVLDVLAAGGAPAALAAPDLVARLASPESCSDGAQLAGAPPAASSARRDELRADIERAHTAARIGDVRGGLERARRAAEAAAELGDGATLAHGRAGLGVARVLAGEIAAAGEDLRAAYFGAREHHDRPLAAETAMWMAHALLAGGRPAEADDWARLALIEASGLGHAARVDALDAAIAVALTRTDIARAEELVARAEADARLGADEYGVERVRFLRAHVLAGRGQYAAAIGAYRDALAASAARIGDDNPSLVDPLGMLALALTHAGDLDGAIAAHERALDLADRALGPTSRLAGEARGKFGGALYHAQRHQDALPMLEAAVRVLAQDAPRTDVHASALNNRGLVRGVLGDPDGALADHRAAIAIWTALYGERHADVAVAYGNLGLALLNQDRPAAAIPELERAIAIWDHLAPDNPEVAFPLTTLGSALNAEGRFADAARVLERAARLRERPDIAPNQRGNTLMELATAVYSRGDRARGKELMLRARALYAEAQRDDMVAAIDGVLAEMKP